MPEVSEDPQTTPLKEHWTPEGPWMDEADKHHALWRDEHTGLLCFACRNWMGVWCGYVVLEKHSPLWKEHNMSPSVCSLKVHGGVNYCNYISIPEELLSTVETFEDTSLPEEERLWGLGFDCSHWGDGIPLSLIKRKGTYRNLEYISNEIRRLARQVYLLL